MKDCWTIFSFNNFAAARFTALLIALLTTQFTGLINTLYLKVFNESLELDTYFWQFLSKSLWFL